MNFIKFTLLPFLSFIGLELFTPKEDNSKHDATTSKFTLTFSRFNHAEWLMEGQTTYILTDKQIKIINTSFGEKKGKQIFSKIIAPNNYVETIVKLRLDTLRDHYTNWCVMTTSGDEYYLDFSSPKQKKKISLHHYYLKQLDEIIQILNALVPKKFQFSYLPKDEKQDCRL
jgi:hypothetical protein